MNFTHTFKTHTPNNSEVEAEIWMDPDIGYGGGYEIWDTATGGNRIYVEGILETERDMDPQGGNEVTRLTGYDGCFELPEYIIEALESKGVIIDL
jgi:hypothetical protein